MKRIVLLVACLSLLSNIIEAQKAERVYGAARVIKPASYYKEQSAAWKKEIDKDPKNGMAWFNYYNANRILNNCDPEEKRSWEERSAGMKKIVKDMEAVIPGTYEYNLCKWMSGGFDISLKPYLEKAAAMGEGRTEHLDFMINISEMERDIPMRDLYSQKKYEANQVSTGILYYNSNVMTGLEKNAIVFTAGDNDTYPIWILQAQGMRKDITVINYSLLMIESYRTKLFKELGVEPIDLYWGENADTAKNSRERYEKEMVQHVAANKKNYPVYVSLTAAGCEEYTAPVESDLFLTGLAYKYSKEAVDNMALLKRNFEKEYALDYIEKSFYPDISPELVKKINCNYVVPMLKLYDHYHSSGDVQREAWIKEKLLLVSANSEDEAEVKKHLEKK